MQTPFEGEWFMPMSRPDAPKRTPVAHGPPLVAPLSYDLQNTRAVRKAPESKPVTLVIDSRDRDVVRFPNPDHYIVDLPHALRNVTSARLLSAELPSSYYVFTAARGNTTLEVTIAGVDYTITIPDGNYNTASLPVALATALDALTTYTFNVKFEVATFRLRVEISDPFVSFSITTPGSMGTGYHWGLGYYLGLPSQTTIHASSGILTGSRPVYLNPETYVILDIEEIGRAHESEIQGRGGMASLYTFAKVPVNTNSFEYAFFDKIFGTNELYPPVPRLCRLTIRWRFHDGTPVDFQGVDHSLTLEIQASDVQGN